MKMRCWRRRTSFSTLRQLIRLQSRAGLAPFASVSCPTVNTPFANSPRSPQAPSLLRQWWNSALSDDSRELPPYPGRYPGPWLGPLSSAAARVPVGPPLTVGPVGISAGWPSVRAACPSSERITCAGVGVRLVRPAGLMATMHSPMRRPHRPRGRCPLRVNSAAELQLTVPCRLLSLTRSRFQPAVPPTAAVVEELYFPRLSNISKYGE